MMFTTRDIIVLAAMMSMAVLCFVFLYVRDRAASIRENDWHNTIREVISEFSMSSTSAMHMIKAKSVEEAVEANALKKSRDVQLKVMEDAMAEIKSDEEEIVKPDDPVKVRTADGREIDLRDWEVVG